MKSLMYWLPLPRYVHLILSSLVCSLTKHLHYVTSVVNMDIRGGNYPLMLE
jgi:hypothetical protein